MSAVLQPFVALLTVEVAAVLVLIAPLPVNARRSLVRLVDGLPPKMISASKYAIAAVGAGWLFTLQELLTMPSKADDADGLAALMHDVRRLQGQRTAGLCGCALLLLLVIYRCA